MKTTFISLIFICLPILSWTQRPWEAGGGIGTAYYFGDLDRFPTKLGLMNPGLTLNLRRNAGNFAAVRGNGLISSLSGNDKQYLEPEARQRGFKFFSPLLEGSLLAEAYPLGLYKKAISTGGYLFDRNRLMQVQENGDTVVTLPQRRKFMPYLVGGAGVAFTDPKVDWNHRHNEAIAVDKKRDYSLFNLVLPFGAGFRVALNQRTTLGLEALWRVTFTDYIDGISKSGNPDENDWYFTGMLTLSRSFGKTDRDKDGITDSDDRCPNQPGTRLTNGCPDADNDGIQDRTDQCPNEPGPLLSKGCPDADNDGIADITDACPSIHGTIALNGCPDKDGDGITDQEDQCPAIAGTGNNKGCPEENTEAKLAGFPAYRAVYFEELSPFWYETSLLTLDEIVQIMNLDPALLARVDGHTDDSTDKPANQVLSELRAKRCYEYLISKGIAASRLTYSGYGGKKPVGDKNATHDPKLSRRVEVHFYK